jgi:hypothetical protein
MGRHTVTLSQAAYAVLCGVVQPEEEVHDEGILPTDPATWNELRALFPPPSGGSVRRLARRRVIRTHKVTLSDAACAVLCVIVQPTYDPDSPEIVVEQAIWDELRAVFPLKDFVRACKTDGMGVAYWYDQSENQLMW